MKRENLYAKPEELVAWYLAGGFVARDGEAETAGSGNMLVSVTRLSCVDQGKVLEKMECVTDLPLPPTERKLK